MSNLTLQMLLRNMITPEILMEAICSLHFQYTRNEREVSSLFYDAINQRLTENLITFSSYLMYQRKDLQALAYDYFSNLLIR
jgi:hypothetical protein